MKFNLTLIAGFLLVVFSMTSSQAQTATDYPENGSYLKFDEPFIKLGKVAKGEKRAGVFKFTNVSKEDVTIEFISVCECTEIDYSTETYKPGETGEIEFIFDSTEKTESEDIVLDILLTNVDPKTEYQIIEEAKYSFELVLDAEVK